jgi:DNA replication protein DnaC
MGDAVQAALRLIQGPSSQEWTNFREREAQREASIANERRHRYWRSAGFPDRQSNRVLLPEGDRPEWEKALRWTYRVVLAGGLAALIGDRGTGKTQIAVECGRKLIREQRPRVCRYARAQEVFSHIRECYGTAPTRREADVIREYADPYLLIIDEAHDRAGSTFEARMLNLIVDKRYAQCLPTIIIANVIGETDEQMADAFRQQIGESDLRPPQSETGGVLAVRAGRASA